MINYPYYTPFTLFATIEAMNLLEYEAKQLLREAGIPVPKGLIVSGNDVADIALPAVLKSQVPTGGRGKLGGITIVDNIDDIQSTLDTLFNHSIKGYLPQTILAEEKLAIKQEFYLSVLVDRSSSSIQLVAHPHGGVEVEENSPDEFLRVRLTPENTMVVGEQLAELYDTPEQAFVLQDLAKQLYRCMTKHDMTLLEINPLVLTEDGKLIAGDCKITLDASAAFRHPEWNFEQRPAETNFVTLDIHGKVATIANGAGLAMATVDAVADYGMKPANFLDIGGGATTASVMRAFTRILEYPDVRVIIINIFAGITRCDEIAKAIIQATSQFSSLPPLCIRLSGTNYEQAAELLTAEQINLLPTLEDCLNVAKEYTT